MPNSQLSIHTYLCDLHSISNLYHIFVFEEIYSIKFQQNYANSDLSHLHICKVFPRKKPLQDNRVSPQKEGMKIINSNAAASEWMCYIMSGVRKSPGIGRPLWDTWIGRSMGSWRLALLQQGLTVPGAEMGSWTGERDGQGQFSLAVPSGPGNLDWATETALNIK